MRRRRSLWTDLARGLAGFLGGFSLLNLLGRCGAGWADATLWWIDLRGWGVAAGAALLAAASGLLPAWAVHDRPAPWRRWATVALLLVLLAGCLSDAAACYAAQRAGHVRLAMPPLSALMAVLVLALALAVWRSRGPRVPPLDNRPPLSLWRRALPPAAVALLCLLSLPLAQMFFFGLSDYRRPADAIVVLGARAYADGSPSQVLHDRVATACRLYQEGLASRLIFSGGPGDGAFHETQVMRAQALAAGVSDDAILVDEGGLNTHATAANTARMFERLGVRRVIAVSHFYHLPRIKLIYRRLGWEVYTVPARQSRPLPGLPAYVTREVAALWSYYIRPA